MCQPTNQKLKIFIILFKKINTDRKKTVLVKIWLKHERLCDRQI